jgi:processive 1,2-diacylglycerol beta-glucosyltransferase
MSRRILILTAGFGEGHNAAARALAAGCDELHGPGTAAVADAFALAAPRLNALARRGYLGLINRAPRVWSACYAWLHRSPHAGAPLALLRGERRAVAGLLAREQPAAVCSTYPVYAFLLADLWNTRRAPRVPHFNVVTDSISINSLWWRAGADGWFLPNEDSAAVMRAAGVDAGRIHVRGFPVPAFFRDHARDLAPPDLAAGATPRVLYIINSGTRGAADTARLLLARTDWEITCTVGRDEALRRDLLAAAGNRPKTAILGWTDDIPRLLMTHHVVVSKAGGATTQEALAARCPMLVNQIVPGQEEGNWELLRRHGVGALAETPDAVVAELQRAFRDRGRVWREWRLALAPLARPNAAREIAAAVGALLAGEAPAAAEPVPMPLRPAAAVSA